MRVHTFRLLAISALLLAAPGLLRADEVFLKGGAKFSGRITEQTDTMITMDIGDGVVGVAMARVDHIVKGKSPLDEYDERAKALQPSDADGWRNLGRWAAQQGLSAQSRQAYQNVMSMAPNDPEARQALGFVQLNGQWMTEEESYRARGYVKSGGEWMTPAEAQAEQATAAADQARQDAERRANQAEADKILAESRAEKAEQRAQDAEQADTWNTSSNYWGYGTWGYVPGSYSNSWPGYKPYNPGNPPAGVKVRP